MSVTQHPRLRSDRARLDYLLSELTRWETNLQDHRKTPHRADESTFTFREAREWKADSQLDLIAEIRDIIDR